MEAYEQSAIPDKNEMEFGQMKKNAEKEVSVEKEENIAQPKQIAKSPGMYPFGRKI